MAVPDRELVITYNSFSVGGSTGRQIRDKIRIEDAFTRGAIEFVVTVFGATQALLAAECIALEAAYRDPYNTLSITMGGETFLDYDEDEALEAMPTVTKEGSRSDTGLSRSYRVRIEYERPADNVPNSGLRERSVSIRYTPARKRAVEIEGVYTAVAGTDARAKYEASIASLASTVLTAIDASASWELAEETSGPNSTNDKIVSFTRVYEEVIYSQAGQDDRASIVRQQFKIKVRNVAPGDTPNAVRLGMYEVEYNAWIDKGETQDLAAQWVIIQPWLIAQVQTATEVSQIAIVDRDVMYDYNENRISARVVFEGLSGEEFIENKVTVADDDQRGLVHLPIWDGVSNEFLEFQGPRIYTRTVTATTKMSTEISAAKAYGRAVQLSNGFKQRPSDAAGIPAGQWRVLRVTPSTRLEERGLNDTTASLINISVVEVSVIMQWIKVKRSIRGGDTTPSGNNTPAVTAETP